MAKQYIIKDEADLRKKINREYHIRLVLPKERKRIVVGFTRFCEMVGNLHAEHYATPSSNAHSSFSGIILNWKRHIACQ